MPEFKLKIEGMHCGACVRRVNQALEATPGLKVGEVKVGEARFSSEQDPASVDAAIAAIAKAGFSAQLDR